jgi:hypothetical protein
MNLKLTVIAIVIMGVLVLTGLLIKSAIERNLCLADVQTRLNYIERKLCDPYSPEVCEIDPTLQNEFDDWKQAELSKCY